MTFRIITAMWLLGKIETAVVAAGGEVIAAGPGTGAGEYRVTAEFAATKKWVKGYFARKFAGEKVTVEQVGN